jgi:hypothetical protein
MGTLSSDLKNMGFERTEQESPFHEYGILWANSFELVCDETGYVIRGGEDMRDNMRAVSELSEQTPRYTNSKRVILPGGFSHVYNV